MLTPPDSGSIVITGAARGIGRALARAYAARGARVALLDVDAPALEALARELPGATAHPCDVTRESDVAATCAAVLAAHGGVRILVCSAGVSAAGPFEQTPAEVFRRTVEVDFFGIVNACRAFLPALRVAAARGENAVIVNVLSVFALFALPTKSAYVSSKHAARAFTETLAAELHADRVHVTAVYPGATATEIARRGWAADEAKRGAEAELLARGLAPEEVARRIVAAVDARRARVLIGRDTRAIALATRLAPGLVRLAIRQLWRRVPFL